MRKEFFLRAALVALFVSVLGGGFLLFAMDRPIPSPIDEPEVEIFEPLVPRQGMPFAIEEEGELGSPADYGVEEDFFDMPPLTPIVPEEEYEELPELEGYPIERLQYLDAEIREKRDELVRVGLQNRREVAAWIDRVKSFFGVEQVSLLQDPWLRDQEDGRIWRSIDELADLTKRYSSINVAFLSRQVPASERIVEEGLNKLGDWIDATRRIKFLQIEAGAVFRRQLEDLQFDRVCEVLQESNKKVAPLLLSLNEDFDQMTNQLKDLDRLPAVGPFLRALVQARFLIRCFSVINEYSDIMHPAVQMFVNAVDRLTSIYEALKQGGHIQEQAPSSQGYYLRYRRGSTRLTLTEYYKRRDLDYGSYMELIADSKLLSKRLYNLLGGGIPAETRQDQLRILYERLPMFQQLQEEGMAGVVVRRAAVERAAAPLHDLNVERDQVWRQIPQVDRRRLIASGEVSRFDTERFFEAEGPGLALKELWFTMFDAVPTQQLLQDRLVSHEFNRLIEEYFRKYRYRGVRFTDESPVPQAKVVILPFVLLNPENAAELENKCDIIQRMMGNIELVIQGQTGSRAPINQVVSVDRLRFLVARIGAQVEAVVFANVNIDPFVLRQLPLTVRRLALRGCGLRINAENVPMDQFFRNQFYRTALEQDEWLRGLNYEQRYKEAEARGDAIAWKREFIPQIMNRFIEKKEFTVKMDYTLEDFFPFSGLEHLEDLQEVELKDMPIHLFRDPSNQELKRLMGFLRSLAQLNPLRILRLNNINRITVLDLVRADFDSDVTIERDGVLVNMDEAREQLEAARAAQARKQARWEAERKDIEQEEGEGGF